MRKDKSRKNKKSSNQILNNINEKENSKIINNEKRLKK
jgi:hypothetical protein